MSFKIFLWALIDQECMFLTFCQLVKNYIVDRNVHRIMKMLGANGSGRVVINFNIALLQCKYGLIFECVWGGVAMPANCYLSLVEGYSGTGANKKEITLLQSVVLTLRIIWLEKNNRSLGCGYTLR